MITRTVNVRQSAFRSNHPHPGTLSRRALQVSRSLPDIPLPVRWALLAFVFTIPLESAQLNLSRYFSLTKLFGMPLFALYFFYYNPFTKRPLPDIPQTMWWFMGYIVVYCFHGLFGFDQLSEPGQLAQFVRRFLALVQLLIFFWIGSSLFRDKQITIKCLLAYSFGWSLLAAGVVFGLPGFSVDTTVAMGAERVTVGSYDPNTMAVGLALAVLALIGMYLKGTFKGLTTNLFLLGMTLPMMVAIAKTGSRSGQVAFILGFSVYLLPFWKSHRKLMAWALAVLGGIGLVYLLMIDPNFSRRWELAAEGNMAGRENIFAASLQLFLEEPISGWGPVRFNDELGNQLARGGVDAHNLYFHLLLEVGLLGTVPFLIGLGLCLRACWKSRTGSLGLMPLSLLTTTLVGNMAITWLAKKPFWLVLAVAASLASARFYQATVAPRAKRVKDRSRAKADRSYGGSLIQHNPGIKG